MHNNNITIIDKKGQETKPTHIFNGIHREVIYHLNWLFCVSPVAYRHAVQIRESV